MSTSAKGILLLLREGMIGGVSLGVSEMTYVSYFLTGIAALSGIMTVVLFFLYDIRRCLRIVRGGGARSVFAGIIFHKKEKKRKKSVRHERTRKLSLVEQTEKLDLNADRSTILLTEEDTTPLETMYLVQDITMIEAKP